MERSDSAKPLTKYFYPGADSMTEEVIDLKKEVKDEKRKYLRTDTSLVAKFSPISQEEFKRKKILYASSRSSSSAESKFYEGNLDHCTRTVLEAIIRLEQKIDRLSSLLFSGEFHKYQYTGEVINISGGGLRLVSPVNFPKGSYLDMCIFFPPAFNNPFFVIGEVRKRKVAMGKNADTVGQYHLGIKFAAIDEKDREAIIRYIFRTERQRLREARLEGDA